MPRASELPPRPWSMVDSINHTERHGYIHIKAADGTKVCDIFPFAGTGGIGVHAARATAKFIIEIRELEP